MLIYLLAIAMTILMLVATALTIHRETQRAALNARRAFDGFGGSGRQMSGHLRRKG